MKKLFFIVLAITFASCKKTYYCESCVQFPNEDKICNTKEIKEKSKKEAEKQCTTKNQYATAVLTSK